MPFGIGGGKKRIIVRKYTALTEGGIRKEYEKDANELAKRGYRPTSGVDHERKGGWLGGQMLVTYELVEAPKPPAKGKQPPQAGIRCASASPDGWQCVLTAGHQGPHSTTAR